MGLSSMRARLKAAESFDKLMRVHLLSISYIIL